MTKNELRKQIPEILKELDDCEEDIRNNFLETIVDSLIGETHPANLSKLEKLFEKIKRHGIVTIEEYRKLNDADRLNALEKICIDADTDDTIIYFSDEYCDTTGDDLIHDASLVCEPNKTFMDEQSWFIMCYDRIKFSEEAIERNWSCVDGDMYHKLFHYNQVSREFKERHPEVWENPDENMVAVSTDYVEGFIGDPFICVPESMYEKLCESPQTINSWYGNEPIVAQIHHVNNGGESLTPVDYLLVKKGENLPIDKYIIRNIVTF